MEPEDIDIILRACFDQYDAKGISLWPSRLGMSLLECPKEDINKWKECMSHTHSFLPQNVRSIIIPVFEEDTVSWILLYIQNRVVKNVYQFKYGKYFDYDSMIIPKLYHLYNIHRRDCVIIPELDIHFDPKIAADFEQWFVIQTITWYLREGLNALLLDEQKINPESYISIFEAYQNHIIERPFIHECYYRLESFYEVFLSIKNKPKTVIMLDKEMMRSIIDFINDEIVDDNALCALAKQCHDYPEMCNCILPIFYKGNWSIWVFGKQGMTLDCYDPSGVAFYGKLLKFLTRLFHWIKVTSEQMIGSLDIVQNIEATRFNTIYQHMTFEQSRPYYRFTDNVSDAMKIFKKAILKSHEIPESVGSVRPTSEIATKLGQTIYPFVLEWLQTNVSKSLETLPHQEFVNWVYHTYLYDRTHFISYEKNEWMTGDGIVEYCDYLSKFNIVKKLTHFFDPSLSNVLCTFASKNNENSRKIKDPFHINEEYFKQYGSWIDATVFEKQIIFVPFHYSSHWSLIVLYRFDLLGTNPDKALIYHMDSLNHLAFHHSQWLAYLMRSFFITAYRQMFDTTFQYHVPLYVLKSCGVQKNGNDCGFYVCEFMKTFIKTTRTITDSIQVQNFLENFKWPQDDIIRKVIYSIPFF